jgi:hypothetical protein
MATLKSQLAEARQQSEFYRFQLEDLRSQRGKCGPASGSVSTAVTGLRFPIGGGETRGQALGAALSRAKVEVEELEKMLAPEGELELLGEEFEDGDTCQDEDKEEEEGDDDDEEDDDQNDHSDEDNGGVSGNNRAGKGNTSQSEEDKQLSPEDLERKIKNAGMIKKLQAIQQSIVDKEELVRELERAEQEIYQLKLQFEVFFTFLISICLFAYYYYNEILLFINLGEADGINS